MSQVMMIFGIAPAIAPIIGGWILDWAEWPAIYWFLVAFSLALLAATFAWLPETHLPAARGTLSPRPLLRNYAAIFRNPRFQRLAACGAFNFAALFLYIASAPAFVLDLLRLDTRQFGWFFVPMIGGMMLGSFASGRAAGRLGAVQQVAIGFACCGAAAVANLAYNAFPGALTLPWAVLPMTLTAFGVALVFPILTLAILDMYPHQRGAASSLQAFTSLVVNAVVAGVLSPLVSHDGLLLAIAGACFTLLAWGFWSWEKARTRYLPQGPLQPGLPEPTDHV
jgi:DHA1 family bicyclomycin/chloramphenicol resistance-like MFS transporter